jgi:opacity protein-like surface antigen
MKKVNINKFISKKRVICSGLSVLISLVFTLTAIASTDSGSSFNLLLKAKVSEDWFVISASNVATRDGFADTFAGFTGVRLGYKLSGTWSVRAGYRHAWFRPGDKWLDEDRPFVEAYYARKISGFRFSSRSRFEFRMFDYKDNDERFRNEFVLEPPWEISPLKLKTYVDEEFFYSFNNERIDMNWLGCGLSWKPVDGVKLKLGYRWNHFRAGNEFKDRNTLVVGINLYF